MASKKQKVNTVIVVPTIREASIQRFLSEWDNEFFKNSKFNVTVLLIEDNPNNTFKLATEGRNIVHYSWFDIEKEMKNISWIIPRRTDCVRSYGYLKAHQMKPDMIVTLDDDCYPLHKHLTTKESEGLLEGHWKRLQRSGDVSDMEDSWISTIKDLRPRGMPYKARTRSRKATTVLNHGLWYNVPDFDGKTQLKAAKTSGLFGYSIEQVIPFGKYFPMCGMNIAWRPEVTPVLYFLLMGQDTKGEDWGMDRFGDIWAGILIKKVSDHLGNVISSGGPIIWHDRASNPKVNVIKEKNGVAANEFFWRAVDKIVLTGNSYAECYREIGEKLELDGLYWKNLKKAMVTWSNLFTLKYTYETRDIVRVKSKK